MLTAKQIDFYRTQGYLVLERQIPEDLIAAARAELAHFIELARGIDESNDVLDLEDSHRPDQPRVRRVKLPHAVSPVFGDLMRSKWILDPVRALIGGSVRLHTSKLNLKSAGYGAAVEWHQDWAFYPHTNDDVLAVGVMLDDVGPENGPLLVYPGSHRGEIFDHHAEGYFCGAMSLEKSGLDPADAVPLTAPAGSISIHHGRTVHGSDLNRSTRDRALLLYEMTAVDAWPLQGSFSEMGTLEDYDTRILCGDATIAPRLEPVPVRLPIPKPPQLGSIYQVQKAMSDRSFDVIDASQREVNAQT
ncbi:phytanoyl-CoA dioxygenase family protein [Denitrobaculum tricleocarpae]|uniref:Phytanoyl-CoA dioxygenase family protein n=1 Tax=Denitrobaculum tricleocarpae TaxID=2591009 RepID=A0A545T5U2_9PROT|nr:phytanoyl-CoA dioxygenase family protein [Denitrobaculum tricleocarpae]TQV72532.1 phytanoyl-CoA dioxygenase family protein [Denitrobaculum tricleocarpae]